MPILQVRPESALTVTNRITRFWSMVDKYDGDGCWEWNGRKTSIGYGLFQIGRRHVYAHRLANELEYGPIPEGIHICHKCDNPSCVRPSHTFRGTQSANVRDMDSKSRRVNSPHYGESHGQSKLNWEQVWEIRHRYRRYSQHDNQFTLAREFGVTQSAIGRIVRNQGWLVKSNSYAAKRRV